MNEETTVICVRNVHKSFGDQHVLKGVTLTLECGDILVVLGRSGTGKSVLLKLIIGLQKPDSGSIRIHGEEITDLPTEHLNAVRKRMGFLFQHAALYDSLTVQENVSFPLDRHAAMPPGRRAQRVQMLLSSVELEDASGKTPSELSGGMRKRVGLARALALDPDILLLDEPTSGLDPIASGEIHELIRNLQQRRALTSIIVTHDLRTANALATRVAFLHEGRLQIAPNLQELARTEEPIVSRFLKESY